MKNLHRIIIASFLLLFINSCLFAARFDNNLSRISSLRKNKKYDLLVKFLERNKSSADLSDLRLFLLAEANKEAGNKKQALKYYNKLLAGYPSTESAYRARLPHFLLKLKVDGRQKLIQLEGLAKTLPTSWQRGTAFARLAEQDYVSSSRKARFLLKSLREFHSEKPFYKKIEDSHEVIEELLKNVSKYRLSDDEWLEVFVYAADEGLVHKFFTPGWEKSRNLLGKHGLAMLEIFRAVSLAEKKRLSRADKILTRLIGSSPLNSTVKGYALQHRAYLNYGALKYEKARADYFGALKIAKYPVNSRACLYRLMRSSFNLKKDSEVLELLGRLLREGEPESLLPYHIYHMALENYDNKRYQAAVPLFMFLTRNFPGYYRADDAIGYSIKAAGSRTDEGKALVKILRNKYPNSFFIYWLAPQYKDAALPSSVKETGTVPSEALRRIAAWKKLWKSDFADFAREEARKLTNKYPVNFPLFKRIITICEDNRDYAQLTAYGERLARQILEEGGSLKQMPLWAWRAYYPKAYFNLVNKNAKKYKIDPYWILSIMREESHFKTDTLSRSNAMGLMQILPPTGKWIGQKVGHRNFRKSRLWRPEINIKFGSWYLSYLKKLFNGDLFLASASYNGGQGNIQRKVEQGPYKNLGVLERLDHVPMSETRDYYKKVMGSYWNYLRLYKQ
ncbi:MAG: transglycosylase SLT domain-containing protein [Candidatus Rifleibacteriota bacterium]